MRTRVYIIIIVTAICSYLYNYNYVVRHPNTCIWVYKDRLEKLYSKEIMIPAPIQYNSNTPVNKTLFRFWCTDDKYEPCGGRISSEAVSERTLSNLPGWSEKVALTEQSLEYITNTFGTDHPVYEAYTSINPDLDIMKADFFRYIIVYMEGGLYLDMKSCVTGEVPDIPDGKSLVASTWSTSGIVNTLLSMFVTRPYNSHIFSSGEFINWMIYARKGSPILWNVITTITNLILKCKHTDVIENEIKEMGTLVNSSTSIIEYLLQDTAIGDKIGCFISNDSIKPTVLTTTGPIIYTYSILSYSGEDSYEKVDWISSGILEYNCESTKTSGKPHYSALDVSTPLICD